MSLHLKHEMGIFQASIMEAFNKLSEQQKILTTTNKQTWCYHFQNLPHTQWIRLNLTLNRVPVKPWIHTRDPLVRGILWKLNL